MSGRDTILSAIRLRKLRQAPEPERYVRPPSGIDPVTQFSDLAKAVNTEVRALERMADVPGAIADFLRSKNMAANVHLPPDAALRDLTWAPALTVHTDAPGPDDAAVAIAPFAIAETGTLAYPARENSPASWHFRAGCEIAVIQAGSILPQMEDVIARLKATGAFPHTLNFVTGPSRTGDIEQTLELGAHGPKMLAVLIVRE